MDYETLVDEVVKEVYCRLNKMSQKVLIFTGSMPIGEIALLKNEFQVQAFSPIQRKPFVTYQCVLMNQLSIESLSNIATGCGVLAEEKLVLHSLLSNIPVYVLESGIEYRNYKETAHKNLYRLYKDYENKIMQYGIIPIATVTELLEKSDEDTVSSITEINFTSKNLLLEADLLKLKSQKRIVLSVKKNCIITPAAVDFIRNHNIKLVKID